MSPEMEALGRRAKACAKWRPMDGMLLWYDIDPDYAALYGGTVWNPSRWYKGCDDGSGIPDLSDPATVGCLEALVCEAWGDPGAHLVRFHTHDQPNGPGTDLRPAVWWAVAFGDSNELRLVDGVDGAHVIGAGPTRAHALVAALEAAP